MRPCSSCTVALRQLPAARQHGWRARRLAAGRGLRPPRPWAHRGHGRSVPLRRHGHRDHRCPRTVVGGPAHLVGWSDGGIVALLVALRRPDWSASLPHRRQLPLRRSPISLDPDSPVAAMIAQAYGERSPDGLDHFPVVLGKAMTMFASEPTLTTDDLGRIRPDLGPVGRRRRRETRPHVRCSWPCRPGGWRSCRDRPMPYRSKPADVARLVVDFSLRPAGDVHADPAPPRRRADRVPSGLVGPSVLLAPRRPAEPDEWRNHRPRPTGRRLPLGGVVVVAPNRPWVSLRAGAEQRRVRVGRRAVPEHQRPEAVDLDGVAVALPEVPRNLPVVAL
jgi:hypothetical protein